MRRFLLLVVIAGLGLFAWRGLAFKRGGGRGGRDGERPVAVECALAERRAIRETRRFTGTLRPALQFDIAPKLGGRLVEVRAELGDAIRSRQALARLDDDEYRVALAERAAERDVALATLRAKEAKIALLEAEHARVLHLRDRKMASEAEFQQIVMERETAIAEREVAAAQLRQREAAVEAANVRLGWCSLDAPDGIDGASFYVGQRFVDPGALVRANEPILRLVSIDTLKAEIHVIERDYERLRPGIEGSLTTDAIPGRSFPCKVARISPVVDEASRQAPVELVAENPEYRLKPGMFVRVEIPLAERANALTVPLDALCERDGREGVFRVDTAENRAVFVPVRGGIRTADRLEILEPPDFSGEVVIVGHHLLGGRGGPVARTTAAPPDRRGAERGGAREGGKAAGRGGKPGGGEGRP